MSLMDSFLNKIKMPGTEYDEFDYDEDEFEEDGGEDLYVAPPTKSIRETKSESKVKVVPFKNSKNQSEVRMIIPNGYDDAYQIADFLKEGKAVVLNLEGMNIEAAQRVIDFATGACYTIGGNLQKISKKIFIVTPVSVELSGDFSEEALSQNVNLSDLDLNL